MIFSFILIEVFCYIFEYRVLEPQMVDYKINFEDDIHIAVIERRELIMQLNSAPLITHEAVKDPSARPLNPTPTVFKFSTEISRKYNTTSKEVIITKKALKVGMPHYCMHHFYIITLHSTGY